MHMDNTITTNAMPSDIATEPVAAAPHQHELSAHELRVILRYRTASDDTRESIRRLLSAHSVAD